MGRAATRNSVCKRGHDLSAPGALNAQGKCKECVKITSREIRAEIRAGNFSRMRKPICKHGHDKRVVGIYSNGGCAQCYRIRTRRREAEKPWKVDPGTIDFRNPICPRGHDKRITGVNKQYGCMECMRQISKAYSLNLRRRWAGFDGDPQKVPNLKAIRHAAGLTAAEMAARIGLSQGGYDHVENGRRAASRRTLAKIVAAVEELRNDALQSRRPVGRFSRLLWAINEAERRGDPVARTIGELAGERRAMGTMLRHLLRRGLAERFEPRAGPRGGRNPGDAAWLLTQEGRKVLRDAA